MEARISRTLRAGTSVTALPVAVVCLALVCFAVQSHAAAYRTANFTVAARSPRIAKAIGDTAERCRRELALEWLGEELPNWSRPCPIKAQVAPQLGAGGATSFVFDRGQVFGWKMDIQGSEERILDSVVPHEVTHTIFASYFRRPLPRWADEGACTTVEHRSEIDKQERMLIEFLHTRRGIPFNDMFAMKEYPQDVLPLYAQGHSLAKYLIAQRGKRAFMQFVENGLTDENWPRAIEECYSYPHLLALQNSWLDWVRSGQPPLEGSELVASNGAGNLNARLRGQDPASRDRTSHEPTSRLASNVRPASSSVTPTSRTSQASATLSSPYARLRDASAGQTMRR